MNAPTAVSLHHFATPPRSCDPGASAPTRRQKPHPGFRPQTAVTGQSARAPQASLTLSASSFLTQVQCVGMGSPCWGLGRPACGMRLYGRLTNARLNAALLQPVGTGGPGTHLALLPLRSQ
jgi:hypothetical protein